MIFKNGIYDKLKTIALIMPLFIVLYEGIGKIWDIPYTEQITLTLTAINGFIGGLVKVSNMKFNSMISNDENDYCEMVDEEDGN